MRTCATCNVELSIGYAVEVTGECFCTAKCLDVKYPNTSSELNNMTDEELDASETYWTEWEVEDEDEDEPLFTLSFNLDDFNE